MENVMIFLGMVLLLCVGAVAMSFYYRREDLLGGGQVGRETTGPPRGLIVTGVNEADRKIYFCADSGTAFAVKALQHGKVYLSYKDQPSGDKFWCLYVSILSDWGQALGDVLDIADGASGFIPSGYQRQRRVIRGEIVNGR